MGVSIFNGAKILCACAGAAFVCFIFSDRADKARTPIRIVPGWQDLISCSYVTSLDGTKQLSISENNRATLYESVALSDKKRGDERISVEGTWSFDEISKQYFVALNGETTAYLLVSPERGGVCMLIAGELEAANLRRSWFSFQADDDDNDPGDQGPGPYER
jgi:hypothetical protein